MHDLEFRSDLLPWLMILPVDDYVCLCRQTGQVMGRTTQVTGNVKTQLIAHDKEVYDIAFTKAGGGRDIFASVGKKCHSIDGCNGFGVVRRGWWIGLVAVTTIMGY